VATGNSLLFLNATIRMQLLPKLQTRNVTWKVLVRTQSYSDSIAEVTGKFIIPFEGPYMISQVIPPSAVEVCHSNGKITG